MTTDLFTNTPLCLYWLQIRLSASYIGSTVPVSVSDAMDASWQPNTVGELNTFIATASTEMGSLSSVFVDKLHIPSSNTIEKSYVNDCWETAVMDEIYRDKQNINISSISSSDTDLDSIEQFCFFPLNDIVCSHRAQVGRYRTPDGTCNNLQYPKFGASGTQFTRIIPVGFS